MRLLLVGLIHSYPCQWTSTGSRDVLPLILLWQLTLRELATGQVRRKKVYQEAVSLFPHVEVINLANLAFIQC